MRTDSRPHRARELRINHEAKAVIFDLMELSDTLADIADACNHILSQEGWPTHSLDAYRRLQEVLGLSLSAHSQRAGLEVGSRSAFEPTTTLT